MVTITTIFLWGLLQQCDYLEASNTITPKTKVWICPYPLIISIHVCMVFLNFLSGHDMARVIEVLSTTSSSNYSICLCIPMAAHIMFRGGLVVSIFIGWCQIKGMWDLSVEDSARLLGLQLFPPCICCSLYIFLG